MGLTTALNTAVSGLLAQQQAIAAASENIANVNTPNFARREAQFFTDAIPGQFAGVDVEIARSAANRFLQAAGFSSAADAGAAGVIADGLANVEASLGAPGDNASFADRLNGAFAAFAELSAAPTSIAARAVALAELDAAFAAFSRTVAAIDGEAAAADARLGDQTARASALLETVFDLNQVVDDTGGAGDAIDAALAELSTLIDISVSRGEDGRVSVSAADGRLLANAGGYAALGVSLGAAASVTLSSVDPETGATSLVADNINGSLAGGEIGGLLSLRNDRLPTLRETTIGAARDIAGEINAVYAGNASVGAAGPAATPLIVETNGAFSVNDAILSDPASLAVARPDAGLGGANDGSGAGAIAALAEGPAARAVASAVTEIGAAARIAADSQATAETFAAEIENRRLAESGVNLDEELSNLILFQRAYSANARVIAAVDELYQSLLSIL